MENYKPKKGDRVLFKVCDSPLDVRIGIVKFDPKNNPFMDLLCEGENMDYRIEVDKVIRKYENVFVRC